MFDRAKQESLIAKQQQFVRAEVHELVRTGRFLYTPLLSEEDPWRTFGLYALDDIRNDQGRLVYGTNIVSLPDVRLVVIEAAADRPSLLTGTIRYKTVEHRIIPGTLDMPEEVPVWKDAGTDAKLPHLLARQVLTRDGFPIVDRRSKGGRHGNVVEYAWLEQAVTVEHANPQIIEVWARIQERIKSASPDEPKKAPSKNPREAQPSLP